MIPVTILATPQGWFTGNGQKSLTMEPGQDGTSGISDQDEEWLISHLTRGLQCYPSAQELSTELFLDFCPPCTGVFAIGLTGNISKALLRVLEDTAHLVKFGKTGKRSMQLFRYSLCQFSSATCSF